MSPTEKSPMRAYLEGWDDAVETTLSTFVTALEGGADLNEVVPAALANHLDHKSRGMRPSQAPSIEPGHQLHGRYTFRIDEHTTANGQLVRIFIDREKNIKIYTISVGGARYKVHPDDILSEGPALPYVDEAKDMAP